MKKTLALLLAALTCGLAACTDQAAQPSDSSAEQTELIVFAAASLTETLTQIAADYHTVAPKVKLIFNFDSSGTLKTQIAQGAVCDLFLSAGQQQMNALDAAAEPSANSETLDFVLAGSRVDLLENKVALAVPADNPKAINSFDTLAARLQAGDVLLAMGNSDVPVGQYTQKIFAYYGLDETALAAAGCLSYGGNVKEVAMQVAEGSVDAGVIYATDAASAGLTVADTATADMCGQVIYPAAIIKSTAHREAAQAFLDYLSSDAAMSRFAAAGFSPAANAGG